ncbi:UDP-glucose--dolichyl-phosphate glucosyltransferase [Brumimicrobium salinarum]|uniref:UDP-glucose--dolichyl-phosphate glucosyltransferase n=1 Tax=Brumimicrobium salinarum TaxID=2058658 RepID=A0A2I0R5D7_9FLAO|nr:glycosyltransferase family 2 protein [Brumimicrobium salinarum]PKR81798.1 UDP-glucose--dolichyl-phosphate glucosyltransferase [Brumimicrobium salinarum]
MSKLVIDYAKVFVVIPAFNEQESIVKVIADIPFVPRKNIIVVNNGSTDETQKRVESTGAIALFEPRKGYGWACLKGCAYVANKQVETIVFLDGDYSDYPEQLPDVIAPIYEQDMDIVIGSRALGVKENGSMTLPQRFGNWLSSKLLKLLYKVEYTDLGPFRAIRFGAYQALEMQDKTYGWTIEMQIKAAQKNMKSCEVPVNYRVRIGTSKVSGTIKGAVMAGVKIIFTVFKYKVNS